ncbi:hypothetical protein E2C01_022630 [Portunus trituberculatus]|uniref:Uncharacterized protein n=1 Tax=Portunus trituberculatus TaxID=210409 RepID=A0A5B7E5V7_PORTR|nr:hypothetical protein [Portunus trituberculatus]
MEVVWVVDNRACGDVVVACRGPSSGRDGAGRAGCLTFIAGLQELQAGLGRRQELFLRHVRPDLWLWRSLFLPHIKMEVVVALRGAQRHPEGPGGARAVQGGGTGQRHLRRRREVGSRLGGGRASVTVGAWRGGGVTVVVVVVRETKREEVGVYLRKALLGCGEEEEEEAEGREVVVTGVCVVVTVGPCVVRVARPGERVVTTEGRVSVVITPGRVVAVRRLLKVLPPRPYRGKEGGVLLTARLTGGSSAEEDGEGTKEEDTEEEGGGEPEMVGGEAKDGGEEEGGGVLEAVRRGGASVAASETKESGGRVWPEDMLARCCMGVVVYVPVKVLAEAVVAVVVEERC